MKAIIPVNNTLLIKKTFDLIIKLSNLNDIYGNITYSCFSKGKKKMEGFVDTVIEHLTNINWEGPAAFVVAVLAVFAFLRKFSLILIIILTIVIGWGVEDIILFNLETDDALITAPLLIYTVGGVSVFFFALYSFFKSD